MGILNDYEDFVLKKNYDEVFFWKNLMGLVGNNLSDTQEEYLAHSYSELMNAYLFSNEFKYKEYIIPIFYRAFINIGKRNIPFVPINLLRVLDNIAPLPDDEKLLNLGGLNIDYMGIWTKMAAETIVGYLKYVEDNNEEINN